MSELQARIDKVKASTNIADIIGKTVKLKKSGRNWMGLCPFHSEKTPSFTVRPDRGFFKCFGCGESGDVFNYLEKMTGKPFAEVLDSLDG